ncbi:hypothetical protein FQN52_002242 [Onygenales sp. PD_12]|nr:hypothetical protein FQN52_002242 [Onygenales sp. PD_12]
MAPEISSKQPAFYRIPVEILTEISRSVLNEDKPRETLKALRLSCPQFAYLDNIQKFLFHSIRLETTPEELERLETYDISRLSPFIKRITFITPKHSWIITFNVFFQILCVQPSYPPEYEDGGTMEQGFEAYMARANQIKTLFDSGRFEKACIAIFEKLSGPVDVAISTLSSDDWGEISTTRVVYDLYAHSHSNDEEDPHNESDCMAAAAVVGDALFLAITAALSVATRKPKVVLRIECVLSGDVAWMHKPKWAGIDLDGLGGVIFEPRFSNADEVDPDEPEAVYTVDRVPENSMMLLSSILEKCQHTLTTLHIHPIEPSGEHVDIIWPPPDRAVVALPKLEELYINHAVFRAKDFATFLLRATNLKSLDLESTDLEPEYRTHDPDYSQYKYIWTAIRRHQSRMQLDFYEIIGNDWSEISDSFHSGGNSTPSRCHDEDDWRLDLRGYVSGTNGWTKKLRWYFDGEDIDNDDMGEISDDEGSNFDEMDID